MTFTISARPLMAGHGAILLRACLTSGTVSVHPHLYMSEHLPHKIRVVFLYKHFFLSCTSRHLDSSIAAIEAPKADGDDAQAPPDPSADPDADPAAAVATSGQAAPGPQVPLPVSARNSHAAVAVDRDLYILGGDASGDLLKEYATCNTGERSSANWLEPVLKGDVPSARKAASAIASGNKIFMFGGMAANDNEEVVTVGDLVVFEINGPNDLTSVINPPVKGTVPPARSYATMCEYSAGKVFLYGGLDVAGKPLNDGWLLDIATMSWEQVFNGHSDLVIPTGSIATLVGSKLVMLNSGAGSPKIDLAASLDFAAVRDSFWFTTKMKHDAVTMLEHLEAWTDKQNNGMELAKNPEKLSQSFESLLKVMDALLQVGIGILSISPPDARGTLSSR